MTRARRLPRARREASRDAVAAICTTLLRASGSRFGGVLFSDDLEMQAVAGRATPERVAPAALAAGCDMLLVCQSLDVARRAIAGVEHAIERGTLATARVPEAIGRMHALRRRIPPRRANSRLGWPAHAKLERRILLAAARS